MALRFGEGQRIHSSGECLARSHTNTESVRICADQSEVFFLFCRFLRRNRAVERAAGGLQVVEELIPRRLLEEKLGNYEVPPFA